MHRYQVQNALPGIMPSVRFPKAFQALTKCMSVFDLDWLKLVPLSCLGSSFSFYDELLVKTLGPFVLAFIIIAFGAFRWWQAKGKRKAQVKANTIEALFLLTYLVLTSVSSTVFRFFHCVEHARGRVDLFRCVP